EPALRADSSRRTADFRLRFPGPDAARIAAQSNPMRRHRFAERASQADAPARPPRPQRTAPGLQSIRRTSLAPVSTGFRRRRDLGAIARRIDRRRLDKPGQRLSFVEERRIRLTMRNLRSRARRAIVRAAHDALEDGVGSVNLVAP